MIRQYILNFFPWLRSLKKIYLTLLSNYRMFQPQHSYSQTGEDLLIKNILSNLHIAKPNYLDIGAYHPIYLSNTYLFYKLGGRGVLIEPDPLRAKIFSRTRPGDIFINAGVGDKDEIMDYYQLDALSTFSQLEKEQMEGKGYQFGKSLKVSVIAINNILQRYFSDRPLDLLSIDTEGYEMTIFQAWNFAQNRPKIICVEAVEHSPNLFLVKKSQEVIDFLQSRGYSILCDTVNNLILVDSYLIEAEQKNNL
jgi:FkbM family methyltransferase